MHAPTKPAATQEAGLGPIRYTAQVTVTRTQKILFAVVAAVAVGLVVALGPARSLLWFVAGVTLLYFADLIFHGYVVGAALRTKAAGEEKLPELERWPSFTVLCPMYREAAVLPQFVRAIGRLDYPTEALQVLLLLEEDDTETVEFARRMNLPGHFEIIVVPDSQPKTKPKACNYGLQVARGDYVVIFDAEDAPEPDQLRKAAVEFDRQPSSVACLQASLNFYNARQNILTRLFTAEYSLWFDIVLKGLNRLQGPLPLGGTSNHFRTSALRQLGGWDPYNVTEDCDLGIRLYKQGFRTGILDSTTYEEANSSPRNWIRQRSRWTKGYMQTVLVHLRGGWRFRRPRDLHFFTFLLVVGGKVAVNFINPLMWALTAGYFLFRPVVGPAIGALYPAPVLYLAASALVVGNALFLYLFLLGSAQRGQWDLVKYAVFAPVYWLLMSIAACYAFGQLIRRPHYWEKTVHGLHLQGAPNESAAQAAAVTGEAA